MVLLQLMANNFDSKNPATWPKNYKSPSTATFTSPNAQTMAKNAKSAAYAKTKDKKGYQFDIPGEGNAGSVGKALFDFGVVQPIKSFGRTLSGKNFNIAANPFNKEKRSRSDILMAGGEDLLNIAAIIPGVKAGSMALKAGSTALRESSALAALKAGARAPKAKIAPKVDIPNNPLSKAESKAFENIAKGETKIAKTETKALKKIVEKEIKTSNKTLDEKVKYRKMNDQMYKNAHQSFAKDLAEHAAVAAAAAGTAGGVFYGSGQYVDWRTAKNKKKQNQNRTDANGRSGFGAGPTNK